MYHLIFVVKIKNNMRICLIGSGLTSLALAKALVNQNIHVEILKDKKKQIIDQSRTIGCLLYTSPSPRDGLLARMPSSA